MKRILTYISGYEKSYTFYYGFIGLIVVIFIKLIFELFTGPNFMTYWDIHLQKSVGIPFIPTISLWIIGFSIGTYVGYKKDKSKENFEFDIDKYGKE